MKSLLNRYIVTIFCCIIISGCSRQWEQRQEYDESQTEPIKNKHKKHLDEDFEIEEHQKTTTKIKAQPLATFSKNKKKKNKTDNKSDDLIKSSKKKLLPAEEIKTLDFEVENKTGKIVYVTCFSYLKKRDFGRWRWDKSPIYRLDVNQSQQISIDYVGDDYTRKNVFGYLGIFKTEKKAIDSILELLPDKNKLDLDQLMYLHNKKVTLEIEKYGFKGEFFEFDFVEKSKYAQQKIKNQTPELDFVVENRSGKPILATCFVYQKRAKGTWFAAVDEKDDMEVWRFDKTPLIEIQPDELGIIDVDTITENRDRTYTRGYLAIFDTDERKIAEESTYELLGSHRKLNLGLLSQLKNKKIVIEIERYGIAEDFVDFVIKPIKRIDFTKIHN